MVKQFFCERCNFETDEAAGGCPRCGRALGKTSTIRVLGWVLVVLGGLLTAFMAWLTVFVTGLIVRSDDAGSGTRFTGDGSDAAFIYVVFGVVLALGVTFLIAGLWQVIYGRRNKKLVFVGVVLAVAFWAIGEYVNFMEW